jgi:hypothetical protein
MEPQDLLKLYGSAKESSERNDFESLWQDATEWCNPKADSIQKKHVAGERKSERRLIDIGIKSRRMFTAGMMSHLFPTGQNWLRVVTEDMSGDAVKAALNKASQTFIDALNASNFYLEIGQCMGNFGDIGNACLYTEMYKGDLNFRSHYIDSFYIKENYREEIDTVFRSFELTARQAEQQFGDDIPDQVRPYLDQVKSTDRQFNFVHITMPRKDADPESFDKKKKPVASYYVCEEDQEWVVESGFDEMPYSVGRFYKTNYEVYGRSPAIEVSQTFPMINSMETSRIRAAERVSNPPWLAPNDGSTRRISNDQGSIIYWNPNNPQSKPEQLIAQDNVIVNDEAIMRKEQEVLDAFYVPLFNPLDGLKNISSATESSQRIDLSMQFLTPAVSRIEREMVKPVLNRAFALMQRAGKFPELDIPELSEVNIDFELVGKANLATRQIELYGTMTALEQIGLVGQVKPEVWDNIDADAFASFAMEVNMAPFAMKVHDKQVKQIRDQRAAQLKAEQDGQQATMAAEAYSKSSKVAEEGSPAAEVQAQAQA